MPRHPDPDLEDRILRAADALWKRGGEKALTMRAVANAAGTNTPAVYRRFRNRRDLLQALLLRISARIRAYFDQKQTLEEMAETYIEFALRLPHEYELYYSYVHTLTPAKKDGGAQPLREFRPNFALLEQVLAKRLGGSPQDHTRLALSIWALLHGTTMLLLSKSIPRAHAEDLRSACRSAVSRLLQQSAGY
jgi:AcrR family transcriptional regulator